MGVKIKCQTVMADVIGRIGGFGHGADCQSRDQILLLFAVDVFHQFVDILGQGFPGCFALHLVTKPHGETAQLREFIGVRFVVDSIDERTCTVLYTGAFPTDKFSHFAVG